MKIRLAMLRQRLQKYGSKFKPMTKANTKPIRIIHLVGGMNRGGPETWLVNVMRHIDRNKFQMDFLVHTNNKSPQENEISTLGGKVIPCMSPSRPWIYARNFRRILKMYGPYDIVHTHVQHYGGFALFMAHRAGVPVLIAQSHTPRNKLIGSGFFRQVYRALMKTLIVRYASIGLTVSRQAGTDLFGPDWELNPSIRLFPCGIDLAPFKSAVNRDFMRNSLGIPSDAFVIGHVGRFFEAKNHPFIIDVLAEIVRHESRIRLVLVGDGPLLPAVKKRVAQAGLSNYVNFIGSRSDVPQLLLEAMDVFLFPSISEGLPLALVEAQAAGLSCIISDNISEEVDVVKLLVRRLSLTQPAAVWAEAVLAARDQARGYYPTPGPGPGGEKPV